LILGGKGERGRRKLKGFNIFEIYAEERGTFIAPEPWGKEKEMWVFPRRERGKGKGEANRTVQDLRRKKKKEADVVHAWHSEKTAHIP